MHTEEQAWDRFLEHAKKARQKPTFDAEEREDKLAAAERLRAWLSTATEAQSAVDLAKTFLEAAGTQPYGLIRTRHAEWLKQWASSDEPSLRQSLTGFVAREDVTARFRSFARVASEAIERGHVPPDPPTVFVLGSLFSFALDPLELPLIERRRFEELERLLHYPPHSTTSAPDEYEHHLRFAREVEERM